MLCHLHVLFGTGSDWRMCTQMRRRSGLGWEEENGEPGNVIKHLGPGQEQDGLRRSWWGVWSAAPGRGLRSCPWGRDCRGLGHAAPSCWVTQALGFDLDKVNPFIFPLFLPPSRSQLLPFWLTGPSSCLAPMLFQPSLPYFSYLLLILAFISVPVSIWTDLFGIMCTYYLILVSWLLWLCY